MWIRPLDALEATPVPRTTGAIGVEWSPDARQLLVRFTGALFARVLEQNDEAAKSEMVGVSFAIGKTTVIGQAVHARVLPSGKLPYASADGSVFLAPFDQEGSE